MKLHRLKPLKESAGHQPYHGRCPQGGIHVYRLVNGNLKKKMCFKCGLTLNRVVEKVA